MVLLEHYRVVQADAVVYPTADFDGVLLRDAQAGQGFARIHNRRLGALYGIDIFGRFAGHTREQLQKVQRRALGREQGAGIALDLQHHLVGGAALAFGHMPGQLHLGVQRPQRGFGPGSTTNHRRFARQNVGADALVGGDQGGGQVAAAHVFGQGAAHIVLCLGSNVVKSHTG